MQKKSIILLSVAAILLMASAASATETVRHFGKLAEMNKALSPDDPSLGQYCIGQLSLAFGVGWFIHIHHDANLIEKLDKIGVTNRHCVLGGTKKYSALFRKGPDRNIVNIHGEYFGYVEDYQAKFPVTLKIGDTGKTLTVNGFCR